jgi:hypothetical protein
MDISAIVVDVLIGGCFAAMADERGGDVEILRFLADADAGVRGELAREALGIATALVSMSEHLKIDRALPAGGWEAAFAAMGDTKRRVIEEIADGPPRPLIFLRRAPWFGAVVIEAAGDLWKVTAYNHDGSQRGWIDPRDFKGAVMGVLFFCADPMTAMPFVRSKG